MNKAAETIPSRLDHPFRGSDAPSFVPSGSSVPSGSRIRASEVSRQLARMLADDLFTRSARLSRFLRYIVEETLQGKGNQLNQYAIALAAFDKPSDFDPNIDPIVRVEAGRLRSKLREYFATSGSSDPIRIGMPKTGYCPFFVRQAPLYPTAPTCTDSAPTPRPLLMTRPPPTEHRPEAPRQPRSASPSSLL